MPVAVVNCRNYLRNFDLNSLFIEQLGWDIHAQTLEVAVDGKNFILNAVAQKRGMAAFVLNGRIPDYSTRRKIERQVAKSAHEHLIIFTDPDQTVQTWQWVKREAGKPIACREHIYHRNQSGDGLIQKLQAIAISIEEEESLTLPQVVNRARTAFDVERVTKRFYDCFKTEHDAFFRFIKGIPDDELHRWYASVMLNRLMFIYFIQKKGFLDGDTNYLQTKLMQAKQRGKDCFYREQLCPLFFEGFAKKPSQRSASSNKLLGKVPYLNGGIFQRHQIEELHGKQIQISDAAFEKLFSFFEQYHWHLDERPLRSDNEINPDVLGYIFEKYINQKQMGAYYTKEDITGYISKYTISPFLFEAARGKCKVAFENPKGPTIWDLLKTDPDRYIYNAVKKGMNLPLPPEIAAGVKDVAKRTEWNKQASEEYALPPEIWREVIERRKRYEEVKRKLTTGEIKDINDLITYNLDIRQFAQDVIENCEGPELLRAFWHGIEPITVLDPTCGSGAFLFAAVNILEPLYEACLDRMEMFVEEMECSAQKHRPEKFSDFRKILERVAQHPNRRYFIFKSIIVNNLYGVDIMEEAVEICKLRLFLKLVAQIDREEQIEPLPDIDFNIRAGNTLIGYATYEEMKSAITSRLDFDNALDRIEKRAQDVDRLFSLFRQQQTELGGEVAAEDKQVLRDRLKSLEDELNQYLANEYGVDTKKHGPYEQWLKTHHPFHWFIEFYGIMKKGGFNVIIGNPPYLELREVRYTPQNFKCGNSGAIHAMCIERSVQLLHRQGCMSMIVPLSLVSTQRMQIVQEVLETKRNAWYSNYSWRPGKLFDTVNRALTIFASTPSEKGRTFSTNYQKWTSDSRDLLMLKLNFIEIFRPRPACWIPKLGNEIEPSILKKCLQVKVPLGSFIRNNNYRIYYRTTGGLYWKVFTDFPPAFKVNGKVGHSSRETKFSLTDARFVFPVIAVLSSDLFWWWYTITTNCRDLNPYDIQNFPIPESAITDAALSSLGEKYLKDIKQNSIMLVRVQRQTGRTQTQSFKIQKTKAIIDEIDQVIANHYRLNQEEIDFITNYDIKYRLGFDDEDNDEE